MYSEHSGGKSNRNIVNVYRTMSSVSSIVSNFFVCKCSFYILFPAEEMMDPKAVPSKDKSSGSLFPWLQREILNSKPLSQLQQPAAVVIETIHQYTHSQPTPEAVQPILVKKK